MSEQFRTPGNLFFDMPSFSADGSRGVFHFFPLPENPRAAEGCYQVTGVFNETSGALAIMFGISSRAITDRPLQQHSANARVVFRTWKPYECY